MITLRGMINFVSLYFVNIHYDISENYHVKFGLNEVVFFVGTSFCTMSHFENTYENLIFVLCKVGTKITFTRQILV